MLIEEKQMTILYAKVHERFYKGEKRHVLAACDAGLLGKVLEGRGGVQLDLRTYRHFYQGEKVSEKELQALLADAENINLVGENTINAASKVLPLSLKDAKVIGGAPHLQFYKL